MWTPDQTIAALAFRGRPARQVVVDAGHYLADPAKHDATARARYVIDVLDVLGVEVVPEDVRINAHRENVVGDVVSAFRLVPSWRPAVRTIEFRGGPLHHQVHERPNLQPVAVALMSVPPAVQPDPGAPVPVSEVEYRMSAWLAGSRVWMFTVA